MESSDNLSFDSATILCVALDPGPAQWLLMLSQHFLRHPPKFHWRLALGPRSTNSFGPEFDSYCLTRKLNDISNIAEVESLLASETWQVRGILLSAAGWPVECILLNLAKTRNIRVAQYVETWYNYRRRLASETNWPKPEYLLLPDKYAIEEVSAEGIKAEHIRVVGNPVWENIFPKKSFKGTQWLFIDAPVRRDYAYTLGYDEYDAWQLVEAEHRRRAISKPILFARHPTDIAKSVPNGAISVNYNISLLEDVGVVFGMFSAPMIDAYLRGLRVVSVQPNLKIDQNPLSRRKLISLVTSSQTLSMALNMQHRDIDKNFQLTFSNSLNRLRAFTEELMYE